MTTAERAMADNVEERALPKSRETEDYEEKDELKDLLQRSVLNLEQIDQNLYLGKDLWRPVFARGVYGGQVVGQALVAASKTKPEHMHCHSIHCSFLRAGKNDRPILYSVDRIRDGRSFCTRSVKALQGGNAIFTMFASYHSTELNPFAHQCTMPEVPPPEDLKNLEQLLRSVLEDPSLPEPIRNRINTSLTDQVPIEIRPTEPHVFFNQWVKREPKTTYWIRAVGDIGPDQNLHRCVAAYISDMYLLRVSLFPFPDLQIKMLASLDHAMWFHTPFKADEWMLYECESPVAVNSRGFSQGRLWKQDGTLAVSTAQEGVFRGEKRNPDKSKI